MTDREVREQRRRHTLLPAAGHWQSLLPAGAAIDQRAQQRKSLGEIFEDALQVSFQPGHPRPRLAITSITPFAELSRHHFLNGFAKAQKRRAGRATPNEIVLTQCETRGEVRRFNQSAEARVRWRREPEPVPPALDDF